MVTPIDTATNSALAQITVGNGPSAIAVTPNGKTVYASNYGIAGAGGHACPEPVTIAGVTAAE